MRLKRAYENGDGETIRALTLAILSGERERSRSSALSLPIPDLVASVAMTVASRSLRSSYGLLYEIDVPPSMTTCECVRESINKRNVEGKRIEDDLDVHVPPWEGSISGEQTTRRKART
jgi:hypothetical protein